jgi:hypothetical protein
VFYLTNPTGRKIFPKSLGEDSVGQEERSSEVGLHTIQTCLRQMAKTSKVIRTQDLVKKPAVSGRQEQSEEPELRVSKNEFQLEQ